jgi:hypothetical protein
VSDASSPSAADNGSSNTVENNEVSNSSDEGDVYTDGTVPADADMNADDTETINPDAPQ